MTIPCIHPPVERLRAMGARRRCSGQGRRAAAGHLPGIAQRPAPAQPCRSRALADVPSDRACANLRASIWRMPLTCRMMTDLSSQHIRLAAGVTVDFLGAVELARRLIDRSARCDENDLGERARAELSSELLPAYYDDWVLVERERFHQLRLHALEALCERLTASGRYGEAIDAGLAAVCAEPLRESSHRVLIKAHLAEGNHAEARRQYELYRQVMRDELGVEPSRSLRDQMTQAGTACSTATTVRSARLASTGEACSSASVSGGDRRLGWR